MKHFAPAKEMQSQSCLGKLSFLLRASSKVSRRVYHFNLPSSTQPIISNAFSISLVCTHTTQLKCKDILLWIVKVWAFSLVLGLLTAI